MLPHPPFFAPFLLGPPGSAPAAASYLGLTVQQLMKALASGKSLSQIAQSRGKTQRGLEQALLSSITARLRQAAKAGHLPRVMEQRIVAGLTKNIQAIVTTRFGPGTGPPRGPLHFLLRPGRLSRPGGRGAPGMPPAAGVPGWAVAPAPGVPGWAVAPAPGAPS